MVAIESLPPLAHAGALIGVVLLEAMILYVGYGLTERAFGQYVIDQLRDN
ncbi:MAG: DUF7512 family protein [Halobacteriota archaeon]